LKINDDSACLVLISDFFIQAAEARDEFDALQAPHPFIRTRYGRFSNEIFTYETFFSQQDRCFPTETVAFPMRLLRYFSNETFFSQKDCCFPTETVTLQMQLLLS
jgi:hypothetical protein